jgi:hypothetical protein
MIPVDFRFITDDIKMFLKSEGVRRGPRKGGKRREGEKGGSEAHKASSLNVMIFLA